MRLKQRQLWDRPRSILWEYVGKKMGIRRKSIRSLPTINFITQAADES